MLTMDCWSVFIARPAPESYARFRQIKAQTIELAANRNIALYRGSALIQWVEPNSRRGPLVTDPDDFYFSAIDFLNTGMEYEWEAHQTE